MSFPAVRSAELLELPSTESLVPYAAWCLEHGEYVWFEDDGLLLMPDLLRAEYAANGFVLPDTMAMDRGDGRCVYAYVVLDGQGYGVRAADDARPA